MIKISQISRKGAKQRKEITKTFAILRASARENRIPKVCCLLTKKRRHPSMTSPISCCLVVLPSNRISMQWHRHASCAAATA